MYPFVLFVWTSHMLQKAGLQEQIYQHQQMYPPAAQSSGWGRTLLMIVVFAIVGVAAYAGFKYFQVRKRKASPW